MAADGGNASAGFDRVGRMLAGIKGLLKRTSATGGEVAPASADMPKARALVAQGRNVFEVDDRMVRDAAVAAEARLEREFARVEDGGTGSEAAVIMAATESVRDTVRGRIDDLLPTPGGKAALKAPRRDGSTDHIGRDTGALHAGLVARLTR